MEFLAAEILSKCSITKSVMSNNKNVSHTLGPGIQMMDPFGCFLTNFNEIFRIPKRLLTRRFEWCNQIWPNTVFEVSCTRTYGNWQKTTKWIHHLYTWPQGVDDISLRAIIIRISFLEYNYIVYTKFNLHICRTYSLL